MATAHCYHCDCRTTSPFARENGYSLVRCDGCGLLFVPDRPDDSEISEAHRQGKHRGETEFDATGSFDPKRIPGYRAILRELFPEGLAEAGVSSWLDVGCGHGEFLEAVRTFGEGRVAVTGTEPNERKRQSARAHGLEVDFFDLATHPGRYDVVSLMNVFSHLPDPPGFLTLLARLVTPRGQILLETGDSASFAAGDLPRPLFLPDHLSFASERIVTELLGRVGFEIVAIRRRPVLDRTLRNLVREAGKAVLRPGGSKLKYLLSPRVPQSDMFIRARRRPS